MSSKKYYNTAMLLGLWAMNPLIAAASTGSKDNDIIKQMTQKKLSEDSKMVDDDKMTTLLPSKSTNEVFAHNKEIFKNSSDAVLGNPVGTKQFAVFVDPYCSHCRDFQEAIDIVIAKMPDLRVVMKDFPILGQPSIDAIKVLKAAQQQGKYKKMQDLIHQQPDGLTMTQLFDLAKKVDGLDIDLLKKTAQQADITVQIDNTMALAEALDIKGTPVSIINGDIVSGEISSDDLEEKLKKPIHASAPVA